MDIAALINSLTREAFELLDGDQAAAAKLYETAMRQAQEAHDADQLPKQHINNYYVAALGAHVYALKIQKGLV